MVTARAAAHALLDWSPPDTGQRALREAFLGFLAARDDGCLRSCKPGHVTASALVLDHTADRVLLTLHPRVGAWIQLGGHCEPADSSLVEASLREAKEESGIDGLMIDQSPLHLDVHPITCSLGLPTRHFDVRFLLRAPAGAVPEISEESDDLRWWPVDALPDEDESMSQLVTLARMRTSR
jgi:8-oxo-dGTP pyrophosphatase MutT (NUDIX family)